MLIVAAPFQPIFSQLGLTTFAHVREHFLRDDTPARTTVVVRPGALAWPNGGTMEVFYKQYEYVPPTWRFIGRKSKAQREYDNYAVFQLLGLPCAQPIAWGEDRDWLGRLGRAFILTRAVLDCVTLPEFLRGRTVNPSQLSAREQRVSVIRQLAGMTRRIHAAGFCHNDLKGRNVLVKLSAFGKPQVYWIDCPRGGFARRSLRLRQRCLKDLASLDKVASQLCTRSERAAFVLEYLGRESLGADGRKLIRDTQADRRKRWPEAWHEGKSTGSRGPGIP